MYNAIRNEWLHLCTENLQSGIRLSPLLLVRDDSQRRKPKSLEML